MSQIPDKHYMKEREEINNRLMNKINEGKDLTLVSLIAQHHIDIENHITILENIVIDLQQQLGWLRENTKLLVETYEEKTHYETKLEKWIIKKHWAAKNFSKKQHK